jgi:hypothetical protein
MPWVLSLALLESLPRALFLPRRRVDLVAAVVAVAVVVSVRVAEPEDDEDDSDDFEDDLEDVDDKDEEDDVSSLAGSNPRALLLSDECPPLRVPRTGTAVRVVSVSESRDVACVDPAEVAVIRDDAADDADDDDDAADDDDDEKEEDRAEEDDDEESPSSRPASSSSSAEIWIAVSCIASRRSPRSQSPDPLSSLVGRAAASAASSVSAGSSRRRLSPAKRNPFRVVAENGGSTILSTACARTIRAPPAMDTSSRASGADWSASRAATTLGALRSETTRSMAVLPTPIVAPPADGGGSE